MRKLFGVIVALALVVGAVGLASPSYAAETDVKMTVNGTDYTSFEAGWNAATSAGEAHVVLRADWLANGGSFGSGAGFYSGCIYAQNKVKITLDLNGHTIDRGMTYAKRLGVVFYIEDSAKITICDTEEDHAGKITGAYAKDGGAFYMIDSAELTLIDVTVWNNKGENYGGAICFEENSKVYLKGETVIENNESEYCGGAIYAGDNAVLEMSDSATVRNNKGKYGGGLYIEDRAKLYMRGYSSVSQNISTAEGGGIYLYWYAKGYLYDNSEVSENRADKDGGGIYVDTDTAIELYDNATVKKNVSAGRGGGICTSPGSKFFAESTTKVYLYGGNIIGNHAKEVGGVSFYASIGEFILKDVTIGENTADQTCGGVYTWKSPQVAKIGGRLCISGNSIVENGVKTPSNLVFNRFTTNGTSLEEGSLIGLTKTSLTAEAKQRIFSSADANYLNRGDSKYFVYDDSNYKVIEEELTGSSKIDLYLEDKYSGTVETLFNGILNDSLSYNIESAFYPDIEEDIMEMLPKSTTISILVGQDKEERLVSANINWYDASYPVGEDYCEVVGEIELESHVRNPENKNTFVKAKITYLQYAAAIGDKKYELLAAALAGAKNGDTIKLLCDNIVYTQTIFEDMEITIDIAGKSLITRDDFVFENYGNLTVTDSSNSGIVFSNGIKNHGTLTVNGGIFDGAEYAFENCDGGIMVINNATVEAPGGIKNENATLTVNGGTFKVKSSAHNTIYAINSNVTINDGQFRRDGESAIIFLGEGSEMTVHGGEFVGATGASLMTASGTPTLTVDGGSFKGSVNSGVALKGTITGGNFSPEMIDFLRNYAASGYVTAKSSDGTEYTVVENVYYTYLGAGLKYSGATADSAKIRFGYDFADDFDLEASDWRWNYGILNKDNLNQSISGENYDSKNVTNLVVAGIVPRRYNDPIYAQLSFNINIDDKTYTIEDSIRGTYINYLAAAIKNNENEPEAVKEYAKQLIEEYIYNTQK